MAIPNIMVQGVNMDWSEIIIITNVQYYDTVTSIAQMVSEGIYIEDYSNIEEVVAEISHIDLIDDDLLNKDRSIIKVHIYLNAFVNVTETIEYLKNRLENEDIKFEMKTDILRESDWANNWKKYYKPFNVGEKLLIKPEWEKTDKNGRIILEISPGLAFGTGTHESTKMCLEYIEKYIKKDMKVLDIGCGSGILGIAALLLGAKSSFGVDIDPLAVKVAKENGVLNNFSQPEYIIEQGNLLKEINEKYNLICANIVADVICGISSGIINHMESDAYFISSGIIIEKLPLVLESFNKYCLNIIDVKEENGWAAVVAKND